jgi:porin-like protein
VFAQASVSNITVDPYGQFNLGILASDTAQGSEHYLVDNDNSASRFGARLKGDVDGTGLTVGAHLELEYQINPSNQVDEDERSISGEFAERHLNVFVAGGFGKLSVGQGDGAANGNIERDLSGTIIVSYTNPALVGGGLHFGTSANPDQVAFGSTMSDQDFESRYVRVRYDLPSFNGFQPAVSHGVKGNFDVNEAALRYSGNLGGKIIAALGYSTRDAAAAVGSVDTLGGSVSWLHDSGFNLTGAYSTASDDDSTNPDSDFYLGKVGYKVGKHAFDVHYAVTEDRAAEGDTADTIGAGYVFIPVSYFNAYAGLNRHMLDRTGTDFDDITTLLVGARVKF